MISFTFTHLLTETSGTVYSEMTIDTSIINNFNINDTVGDELYLRSGNLNLELKSALTYNASYKNWIVVYLNNVLHNVYYFPGNKDRTYDEKRGFYKYTFYSIQQYFWELANDLVLENETDSDNWNYNLNTLSKKCYYLPKYKADMVSRNCTKRWVFALGDLLDCIETKHNSNGFKVNAVVHNVTKTGYALPVLWRGDGVFDTETAANAVNKTFKQDDLGDHIFEFTVIDITNEPATDGTSIYTHNSSTYTITGSDLSDYYKFSVSGVSTWPEVGSVYVNDGTYYTVTRVVNNGTTGSLICSGDSDPEASGNLAKDSGVGDATIAFGSWTTVKEGTLTGQRAFDDNTDPSASGTLTRSNGSGDSTIYFTSYSDESDLTTYNFNTTWLDIFIIASVYLNAYIYVKPKIPTTRLNVDVYFTERSNTADGSPLTGITFIERKTITDKYRVDGVKITTDAYDYTIGDTENQNLLERDIPVAEPGRSNSGWIDSLYFGVTEQDSIHAGYDYTQPNDVFYEWDGGGVPDLDAVYQDMIDGIDGVEGQLIPYSGSDIVRLLDQISYNSTQIQIIDLKIKKRGFASFKAMKVS